jgi:hypothetical protein
MKRKQVYVTIGSTLLFVIKPSRCTNFKNLFWREVACFGQFLCPSSGVHSLYTQQWYISYRFVDSCRAGPEWMDDDGHRNCPKHVEFHTKINL